MRRAGLEPATRCLEGSRSVQTELPALDLHVCRPTPPYIGYLTAASHQTGCQGAGSFVQTGDTTQSVTVEILADDRQRSLTAKEHVAQDDRVAG